MFTAVADAAPLPTTRHRRADAAPLPFRVRFPRILGRFWRGVRFPGRMTAAFPSRGRSHVPPARLLHLIAFAVPSFAGGPKKVALLVGVMKYENKNFDPLRFTENDVTELGDVLLRAGHYDKVVVLSDSPGAKDAGLKPTKSNVLARLDELKKGLTRDDTIFVAFAGHGLQFGKDSPPFFCPVEADKTKRDTLIDLDGVVAILNDSGAGLCLMAVDACRDDPTSGRNIDTNSARGPKGGAAFFSCSKGQFARETPKLKHGVFFHFFVRALTDPKLANDRRRSDVVAGAGGRGRSGREVRARGDRRGSASRTARGQGHRRPVAGPGQVDRRRGRAARPAEGRGGRSRKHSTGRGRSGRGRC